MKFVMTYQMSPENRNECVKRFLATGGTPPAGVNMLGRWHATAGLHGFVLLESEDPTAMYRWASEWHDLLDFDITPVVEDAEAAAVLQSMQ